MFKKITRIVFVLLLFWSLVKPVFASEDRVKIYFFWSDGCPHCAKEKIFLESLENKYEEVEVKDFNIGASQENIEIFREVGKRLKAEMGYIPFVIVGEEYFIGYLDDQTTGQEIEEAVKCALDEGCPDVVEDLIFPSESIEETERKKAIPKTLKLPFLGEVETKNLSLPLLTFVIALLDGFNPCAMWTLLFLISLLLGMKDRKRMWILGSAFIVASGAVYLLFLSAWLNLFLFLGLVLWVRIVVGLVALGAGGYSLRDFWVNRTGGCEAVSEEKRKRIFARMKEIAQRKEFLLALGGMLLLAFAVNLIELVCSAGLPAIYTQILSLTKIPRWQYYLYLLFYILIFMLDDLFVFFVAMTTLRAVGIQSKYARYSRLIGGSLMLMIGLLLLFKPEWLMFG